MASLSASGAMATKVEKALLRQWAAAKFEATATEAAGGAGLLVLANHDPVILNNRGGRPLRTGGKEYRRGLYCHAVSKVVVRLPGPGKTFTAVVGVDSHAQTSGGRGSVVFSVTIGGKEAFRSKVIREGMAGVPVSVDLAGATEFVLNVGDGGDGISCDQSDWADAKVVLADGETVWVGDLPFIEAAGVQALPEPPFSFVYDGRPSVELLPTWKRQHAARKLDAQRTEHVVTYTEPKTGLVVRCVAVEYHDFPTVEWTLYFKNTGKADTPILKDIQALDTRFQRGDRGEFLLHHHVGSTASMDDYRPLQTPLRKGETRRFASSSGRGSDGAWPYYNVEWAGAGLIVAVGWPGQWAATFRRDGTNGLHLRAGQERTHLKLLPGEEIRTPLIALQVYRGDWLRAQNVWRRWMLAHNLPRLENGKVPGPLMPAASSNQCHEMQNANETNQKQFIDGYLDNGVHIDFWWMDAGWYVNGTSWPRVGTWEVDRTRFPKGLRAISDHAHGRGVRILVWFEPERVTPGTWLYEKHPEWLLGADGQQKMLYLGNPEARKWLTDHVAKLMTDEGIDIYRQDCNFDLLGYWRGHDAPDRQGITEIRHVTGYLAYWDELRRRRPGLLIDTCASGGRRNDLETLRRSVPLHKSDMQYANLTSKQTQLYGLAFWVPYFGAPVYPADRVDTYGFRSGIAPMTGLGYDTRRKDYDYALLRKLVAEWKQVVPNQFGDYWPLTSWRAELDVWMAWQFDRPEVGEGVVQAFRRPESIYESARFVLRGLEPSATYEIRNADVEGTTKLSGRELMEKGLLVSIPTQPGAAILFYKRLKPAR
ncbi:MAG: alpha-galactosidase [Candidatus Brocadiae bacterium]|nr:alpha-galactosidase [Candidatus Brocadiia bacterium]